MASKACRWPGDNTPLSAFHGGTKAAALRAIKEASSPSPTPARTPSKRVQEYERAREIAAAQLEQLLSKLPLVTTPQRPVARKDRVRPRSKKEALADRREWLRVHREAQDNKCHYCRVPMWLHPIPAEAWRKPSLDHVVPLSKGGDDSFENTVAACRGCNNAKGCLSVEEFKADFHTLRQRMGAP